MRPSETAGTRTYPQAGHPCLKKRSQDSQTAFGRPRNCDTIAKSSSFEPEEWVSDFQAPKKYVRDTFLHKMSYSVREGLIFIVGKDFRGVVRPNFSGRTSFCVSETSPVRTLSGVSPCISLLARVVPSCQRGIPVPDPSGKIIEQPVLPDLLYSIVRDMEPCCAQLRNKATDMYVRGISDTLAFMYHFGSAALCVFVFFVP